MEEFISDERLFVDCGFLCIYFIFYFPWTNAVLLGNNYILSKYYFMNNVIII